jgi:hypothetical protein
MAQFVGAATSLRDADYTDLRSTTSQGAFQYVTRMVPTGICPPKDMPYTCGWSEGGVHLTDASLRVGSGLTRQRGGPKLNAQMVGPARFQKGNGDSAASAIGTKLRDGTRQVLRGSTRPSAQLQGRSPFQQGQSAWTSFASTADKGRNKYEYATQCTAQYLTAYAPDLPQHVEPFTPGGLGTRQARDF